MSSSTEKLKKGKEKDLGVTGETIDQLTRLINGGLEILEKHKTKKKKENGNLRSLKIMTCSEEFFTACRA